MLDSMSLNFLLELSDLLGLATAIYVHTRAGGAAGGQLGSELIYVYLCINSS